MLQGQLNQDRKIAHRGNLNQAPTSIGRVSKGHFGGGFITPNSLGARITDQDRIRRLNGFDIKFLNEKTPLNRFPPQQIEANKTLIPLGILQDQQSQFPFIANTPLNFVYKKEVEQVEEQREKDMLKETEKVLERIEAVQKKQLVEFA